MKKRDKPPALIEITKRFSTGEYNSSIKNLLPPFIKSLLVNAYLKNEIYRCESL